MQLMVFPANGFAYGTQPIISYNFGAGNFGRVKQNFRIVSGICFAYTALFYLAVLLFPKTIAALFTSDAELCAVAAGMMPIYLAGMVVFAFQISAQTSLLGTGQAKISLFIACLRKIILLTPLAIILPRFIGVEGIYWAEPVSDTISALTSVLLFAYVSRKVLKSPTKEL